MGRLICCDLGETSRQAFVLEGWDCEQLDEVPALLTALDECPAQVVVIRAQGDDSEALRLLRKIGEHWPWQVRILLADAVSARYLAEAADVADVALPSGCEASRIQLAIERAEAILTRLQVRAAGDAIERLGGFGVLPAQLAGLNALIDDQIRDSTAPVAPLFRGCTDLLTELMELLNSPLFGFDRHLFSIVEAGRLAGLRTLRDMTLLVAVLHRFPQPEQWRSFSFQHQLDRALVCARLAQRIAHSVNADRISQHCAFAAGLFADFGIRGLIRLDPARYHRVMERASALGQPIFAVEKLEYGLSHGELGAALLRGWGVSPRVVRAVLYHHVPKAAGDGAFSTVTATHVADALLPTPFNTLGCRLGGRLSLSYLDAIGEMDRRILWDNLAEDQARQLEAHW